MCTLPVSLISICLCHKTNDTEIVRFLAFPCICDQFSCKFIKIYEYTGCSVMKFYYCRKPRKTSKESLTKWAPSETKIPDIPEKIESKQPEDNNVFVSNIHKRSLASLYQ